MKNSSWKLAMAVGAVCLSLSLLSACTALAGEQKIATVDLQTVFEKYYKTDRSNQALKLEAADIQKELKDMVEEEKKLEGDWQKLIDKANDQAVSAEERAKSKQQAEEKYREVKTAQQSIQEYDRASGAKLQEKKRQRRDDLVKEIRGVLDADAKAAGYTLVLDVSGDSVNMVPFVLYSNGVNDLTTNLIKELNAGAPTAPDDKGSVGAAK